MKKLIISTVCIFSIFLICYLSTNLNYKQSDGAASPNSLTCSLQKFDSATSSLIVTPIKDTIDFCSEQELHINYSDLTLDSPDLTKDNLLDLSGHYLGQLVTIQYSTANLQTSQNNLPFIKNATLFLTSDSIN